MFTYRAILVALLCGLLGAAGCGADHAKGWSARAPVIRRVADRAIEDFAQPPPFNWGEGVLMAGMMRAGLALNEARYVAFVQKWADRCREQGLASILEVEPDAKMKGYCGRWGPGFPVVMLYERTRDSRYLEMARQIAGFIETKATRTADGGIDHWRANRQLWVDTLYMVCPLMANLARLDSRPEYLREAVKQLDVYATHCQDAGTGLFYHTYDEPSGRCVGVLWGRGNGWVVMSYVEVLKHLDRKGPEFAKSYPRFRLLVDGLLRVQDSGSGLWHTVLDRPDSYLETSASAMILSALAEGRRLGLIRPERRVLDSAWAGVAGKVDAAGRVVDVSGGTGPGPYEQYATKVRGTETWGTGAFLLAGCALGAK